MLIHNESERSRHDTKLQFKAKNSVSQRVLQDLETHFVCGAYRHGLQRKHYITEQIKAQSQVEQTAVYSSLFLPFSRGYVQIL